MKIGYEELKKEISKEFGIQELKKISIDKNIMIFYAKEHNTKTVFIAYKKRKFLKSYMKIVEIPFF